MKNIVIIEDDKNTQKIYYDALVSKGHKLTQFFSGDVAMFAIKQAKPDLILLDIMLPGDKNGFDILEELKADPDLEHVPVLVLTNLDTEEKAAKEIGVADYVVKANISLESLLAKINMYLMSS